MSRVIGLVEMHKRLEKAECMVAALMDMVLPRIFNHEEMQEYMAHMDRTKKTELPEHLKDAFSRVDGGGSRTIGGGDDLDAALDDLLAKVQR